MTWLRSLFTFVLAGAAVGMGCGSSEGRTQPFGQPAPDDADAANRSEVPVYDEDGGPDAAPPESDVHAQAKCTPSSTSKDQGTVCLHVFRATEGPAITADVTKSLNIDGDGVLAVMLMPDPWVKTSKPSAMRIYPSPSTPHFYVSSDVPKTIDLDAPPGKYLAFAVFYDAPGYVSRDFAAGDYIPKMATDWTIPSVTITGGGAVEAELGLYPVRTVDVTVSLAGGTKPVGSGTGPLVASLLGADGTTVVGDGRLPCADVTSNPVVHLVTTAPSSKASATTYPLEVALYDFAAGPDDPTLDTAPFSIPAGTIVSWDATTKPQLSLGEGWVTPPIEIVLDRVVPFSGVTPTDPTPGCTAYTVK